MRAECNSRLGLSTDHFTSLFSTRFDPEPKVGVRHIDLLNLYKRVIGEGGYDLCSDTKAKPLMWRKFAEEFVGKNQYTAAQAFQIKNVYYKNLVAYEISTHWKKEPPPKEILEEMTAKGGNVMTRTLENYSPRVVEEPENAQPGGNSDGSPERKTPNGEKTEEDPGSASRTRGLRQQPPQRVLFQPDLTAGRQARAQTQTSQGSPVPPAHMNGFAYSNAILNGASSTLASYEPSQSYPLSLKPVVTPANNPEYYRSALKRKREAAAGPLAKKYKNIMLPGTGFIGPNIYVRAQLALQSGLPEEEQYALHHLVKISNERGDKYRFDQFPGLAESLMKKGLQVSSLFYDVEWEVSYDGESISEDEETLDGLRGTSDVIQKLRSRIPLVTNDSLHDAAFLSQLNRITEAGLVIRNMCMLDENARYLSRQALTRDFLAIVLDLPPHQQVSELQHYALEIAEQVLMYCDIGSRDALYHSLVSQLLRDDRGAITLAVRTISRIAMHLSSPKRLDDISDAILRKIQDWLMVDDEELRSACLDFLTQYTSFSNNVKNLLQAIDPEALVRQLSRLLSYDAKEHKEHSPSTRDSNINAEPSSPVPRLSRSIVEQLLKLEEPQRSSEWLRMCFVSDLSAEMTQISLWQAYQATFGAFYATHPHLIAGEFIKNVSTTFSGATAQVAGSNKYVIKGIRARRAPVESGLLPGSVKGQELQKCCWRVEVSVEGPRDQFTGLPGPLQQREQECAQFSRGSDDILKHILASHLQFPIKDKQPPAAPANNDRMDIDSNVASPLPASINGLTNGTNNNNALSQMFDFREANARVHRCRWSTCPRSSADFGSEEAPRTLLLARHVQTHLPSVPSPNSSKHNLQPNSVPPRPQARTTYVTTLQDEKGDAAGLPLGAALVLRNIAKFMPSTRAASRKTEDEIVSVLGGEKSVKRETQGNDSDDPASRVFGAEVSECLFHTISTNRTTRDYLGSILRAVRASEV